MVSENRQDLDGKSSSKAFNSDLPAFPSAMHRTPTGRNDDDGDTIFVRSHSEPLANQAPETARRPLRELPLGNYGLGKKRNADGPVASGPSAKKAKEASAEAVDFTKHEKYEEMLEAWKAVDACKDVYPCSGDQGWADHFTSLVHAIYEAGASPQPWRRVDNSLTRGNLCLQFLKSIGSCESLLELRAMLLVQGNKPDFLQGEPKVSTGLVIDVEGGDNYLGIWANPWEPVKIPEILETTTFSAQSLWYVQDQHVSKSSLDPGLEHMRKLWFHRVFQGFEQETKVRMKEDIRQGRLHITEYRGRITWFNDHAVHTVYASPFQRREKITDPADQKTLQTRLHHIQHTLLAGKRWQRFCEFLGADEALWLPMELYPSRKDFERQSKVFWGKFFELLPILAPRAHDMAKALHESRLEWKKDDLKPPALLKLNPGDELYGKLERDVCTVEERIALLKTVSS